jgi:hypothetical protein
VIISVDVIGCDEKIGTGFRENPQLNCAAGDAGEQESRIDPLYPPDGARVSVEVAVPPELTLAGDRGVAVSV